MKPKAKDKCKNTLWDIILHDYPVHIWDKRAPDTEQLNTVCLVEMVEMCMLEEE
jgi:hypothetical protein